ncbi:MAG: 1-deoxy-D-xylulose-5-phosphate synthase [Acidimicrobiales bacterium]|jgi:hypothetical protein|nr:1-deoxy-D-xylulose-5-phosphate synthase [Acidimicrobiales bacterium]
MKPRIMYVECKAEGLSGPARIGRVTFSKTGRSIYYGGKTFRSLKGGCKANYYDVETGDEYWISGPKKDGTDRLYGERVAVDVDDDVRVLDSDPKSARTSRRRRRESLDLAIKGLRPAAGCHGERSHRSPDG